MCGEGEGAAAGLDGGLARWPPLPGPRHTPTIGTEGQTIFCERGTPVANKASRFRARREELKNVEGT